MIDVTKWETTELQALRAQIEAELARRMSTPFGAGRLVDPAAYGCCGQMPCQRTFCPASVARADSSTKT